MAQTKYSADALLQFLDRAGQKGWLPKGTVAVLKSNSKRVLWALDDSARDDVRQVEVDAAVRCFANLNPEVSPQSLRDYRGRLEKSISLFTKYTDDPIGFKMPTGRSDPVKQKTEQKIQHKSRAASRDSTATTLQTAPSSQVSVGGHVYHFPLRSDLTIMLANVPRDLKQAEVKRLTAFLNSLAEDFGHETF